MGGCDTRRVPPTGLAQGEHLAISRCGVSLLRLAPYGLSPEPCRVRTKAESLPLVSLKGSAASFEGTVGAFYGRSHFMGPGVKAGGWRRVGGMAPLTRPWVPQHNALLIKVGPPPPPNSVSGSSLPGPGRGGRGAEMGFLSSLHCHLPSPQPCPLPSLRSITPGGMPTHLPAFQCPYHFLHTLSSGREWRLSQWLPWRWCGPLSWMQLN